MNYFDRLAHLGIVSPADPFAALPNITLPTASLGAAGSVSPVQGNALMTGPAPAPMQLAEQPAPYFQNAQVESDPFAGLPEDGSYVGLAPVELQNAPEPVREAPVAPQAVSQPQPVYEQQPTPAPAPQPVQQPVQQQPLQQGGNVVIDQGQSVPTPQPDPNAVDPELMKRAEALRNDVAAILNGPGTAEEVRQKLAARAAQEGRTLSEFGGIEQALAARKADRAVSVGIQQPYTPTEYHGEDKGAGNAAVVGAIDSVTLGAGDEIGGALGATVNSIGNVVGLGNGNSWSDEYARVRDDNRRELADAEHYHGGAYLAGQVGGGILTLPFGGGQAALARGGLSAAGRLAAEGAVLGGAYGFNSAEGGLADRATAAGEGALLGGAGGVILGGPTNALARRIAPNRATPSAGREILDAAERLSVGNEAAGVAPVRPLAAHTSNGGLASEATAMLSPTITGGRVGGLNRAMEQFENQVGATVGRVADDAAGGQAVDLATAAQRANDPNNPGSLAAFAGDTEVAARQVYGAAEQAAGGARVPTPATIQRIDEVLAEWDAVPGGVPGAEQLRALRDQLSRGPDGGTTSAAWTIEGLRRLRTSFGDRIESNQRQLREASKRIWGPLSKDIFRGLRVAGRADAANLYRQADRQWARRAEGIEVIQRVIGKDADLSADAVAQRVSGMSAKDYGHLSSALGLIDPAQANAIRGGLITKLGEALPSRATEPGEFSIESFATRWAKMSPQARSAMFTTQTVRDLDDLARLAGSNRRTTRLGNSSRSGVLNENLRQTRAVTAETVALAGGFWNPTVWAGLVGSYATGRLLATPGFARALVRASESRSLEVLSRRLSEVARRYPAAEQDIFGFQSAIAGQAPANAVTIKEQTPADPFADLPTDGETVEITPSAPATVPAQESAGDDPFAGIEDDGEYIEL
jgi:hypothetical protein